jgi:hypothetical protein
MSKHCIYGGYQCQKSVLEHGYPSKPTAMIGLAIWREILKIRLITRMGMQPLQSGEISFTLEMLARKPARRLKWHGMNFATLFPSLKSLNNFPNRCVVQWLTIQKPVNLGAWDNRYLSLIRLAVNKVAIFVEQFFKFWYWVNCFHVRLVPFMQCIA